MKKMIFALIITMMFCVSSFAQMNDWKTIEGLPKEQKIVVETKDGKTLRGRFSSATSDKLSLVKGSKTVEIAQSNVRSVYIGKKKRSFVGGVIGAITGTLLGGVAAAAIGGDDVDAYASGTLALGGLIGGGFLGQKAGTKIKKAYIIYQAP